MIWAIPRPGYAPVLPTPVLHAKLATSGLTLGMRELDLRHWLLTLARIEKNNSESVLERVIADSSDAVFVVDEAGSILRTSERAYDLFESQAGDRDAPLDAVVPSELAAAVMAWGISPGFRSTRSSWTGCSFSTSRATPRTRRRSSLSRSLRPNSE